MIMSRNVISYAADEPFGRHAAQSVVPASRKPAPAHRSPQGSSPHGASSRNRAPRKRRGPLIAFITIIVIVGLIYAAGVAAFSFIFYPHTQIAGTDVSLLTEEAAVDKLESAHGAYALDVTGDGFTWRYEPDPAKPIFNAGAIVSARLGQNEAFAWPYRLYRALTADTTVATTDELEADPDLSLLSAAFDRTAFERDLGAAVDAFNATRSGAFDTQGAYDPDQGLFTVEHARANQRLNRDAVINLALNAVARLQDTASLDQLGEGAYEPLAGGKTDEELQAACDAANQVIGMTLTFKLGDNVAATLDGATLQQWLTFDENLTPSVDAASVAAWATELAGQVNTVGTTRTYTRPDGKVVTVGGGTYGWAVDEDALVQTVQAAVAAHQTAEVAIPTSSEGVTYAGPGQPDWGAYADVDISEQRARYYGADGTLLWESGIVTGKPDGENDTPTGIYYVNNKLRNITLVGKKDPETGEPEYESPVQYWIAFVGSAIGFHDASWQNPSVYDNPSAYTWAGSHGCINTPLDKVTELYNLINVGDCVIVHN